MGLRDRVRSALGPQGSGPAAPPQMGPSFESRHDAIALAAQVFDAATRRLDSIRNTLSGLGGANDKGTTGRPDTNRLPLTMGELTALYRFNGYAKRIVNLLPEDATRQGWRIVDETDDADPMADEDRRLKIPQVLCEGLRLGRLYGGGVVVPILEEDIPAEFKNRPNDWLRQPLDLSRVIRVKNLVAFDRYEAQPLDYDANISSPTFRAPLRWQVTPQVSGTLTGLGAGGTLVLHASRVIYLPGAELPPSLRYANGGFDESILEAFWDKVRNKESIDQAAALLAQELKINVLSIRGLAEAQTNDQAALFETRMRALVMGKSIANTVLLGEGEEFKTMATPFTGFEQLDENAMGALSAVTGMPRTKLFGEAPGGLNSDGKGQKTLWDVIVDAYQTDRCTEPLTRIYTICYAAKEGPTRGAVPKSWKIEYGALDKPTKTEEADLRNKVAQTDQVYVDLGVYTAEDVRRSRFGKKGWSPNMLPVDAPAEADPQTQLAALEEQVKARLATTTPAAPTIPGITPGLRADAQERYVVPAGARGNAKKVLRWREEHPDAIQGMQETGWRRARQLATERTISAQDIVEIAAWFARHGEQAGTRAVAPEFAETPWRDAGYVAWLGWGGDTMRSYAKQVREGMEDRADATEGAAWIGVPLPEAARAGWLAAKAAVEAITGPLDVGDDPHITVLYLGQVPPDSLQEITAIVETVAAKAQPEQVQMGGARAFPATASTKGRIPVHLEVRGGWALRDLNDQLTRRLAHRISTPQHARFVPHVTLGYADALTDEQRARLAELALPELEWTAARLELRHGGQVVRLAPLEGRLDTSTTSESAAAAAK